MSAYKQWRDPVRTTKAYPPHGNKRGEGSLDGFDVAAEGVYEHRSLWESVTSVINSRFFTRHADDGRTYRRKAWQHGVDLFRCLFDQLCRTQYPDPVRDSLGFQHLPSQEQRTSYFCKTQDIRSKGRRLGRALDVQSENGGLARVVSWKISEATQKGENTRNVDDGPVLSRLVEFGGRGLAAEEGARSVDGVHGVPLIERLGFDCVRCAS